MYFSSWSWKPYSIFWRRNYPSQMRRKRGLLTTIIRGVPSTSHESMKNEEGLTNIPSTSQHRWGFAWSFVLSLWRSRFPTPGAPLVLRLGIVWPFRLEVEGFPPWFQHGRWRSFAVMYDGMWRSLLTTYPRPFVMGGRCCGASRSEEVWKRSTFSVWCRVYFSAYLRLSFPKFRNTFCSPKISLANLLSGKE